MQIPKDSWVRVDGASPALLILQNVGVSRIAYVIRPNAEAAPQSENSGGARYVALDSDAHFIMAPGSEPVTMTFLATETAAVWARSLGAKVGALAVSAP